MADETNRPGRSSPGTIVSGGEDRPDIDPAVGLRASDVAERVASGLVNDVPEAPSRTLSQIIRGNVLTRFNALMAVLGALVLAAGSAGDGLFLLVVLANTAIGIAQELRAKATLDRLAVLNAPKATIVRDGASHDAPVADLVLDDIIELRSGSQVVADAIVRTADNLEVDESLLTGESDALVKVPGDEILSGSIVVAGSGRAQVHRVGKDAYAAQLAEQARRFTLVRSELRRSVNRIVQIVTWLIIPTGVLLFISQFRSTSNWQEAVIGAVAGVVGMVPEGLVLLTSVAFAVGVLRLAKRNTLVNELPAIEVLARVDVLCLDKTGTLTEGALDVAEVRALGTLDGPDLDEAMTAMAAADPDPNATQLALRERYGTTTPWQLVGRTAFSSARKWAAATFADHGTFVLGAPEMVLGDAFAGDVAEQVGMEADAGRRVLLLARSDAAAVAELLPSDLEPVALVLLEDRIRPDAAPTLAYFAAQGVTIKVISGDNPRTVAAVARRAGLTGGGPAIDARSLPEDTEALAEVLETTSVFGRVTPHQKRAMVIALQSRGHTVAMTGDGVNDCLALKESDCGIAMASGSEATRAVAQLVLLDSSFASLPKVVSEGRRVINNIERVASLFLVKTCYSFILALATGIGTVPYPFRPRHLTIISSLTIGIPAFFLALAPNDALVRPGFLRRVAGVAVPGGVVIAACTMLGYGLARLDTALSLEQDRTTAVMIAGGIAFVVLTRVARPLNPLRLGLVATLIGLFVMCLAVPALRNLFVLELPGPRQFAVVAALIAVSWPLLELGARLTNLVSDRLAARHPSTTSTYREVSS